MISKLFDSSKVMEKTLDASWARNEAISQNIANIDTPNYKRKTVSFENMLSQAVEENSFKGRRTDKRHIPIGSGEVDDVEIRVTEDNNSLSMRLDGNNVDIESEMADMAKNTIKYNAITQRLSGKFRSLRTAINEGRK